MRQAIVFDFDGTLVDASEAICNSFNRTLEDFGVPLPGDEQIRSMIGRPLTEMFAHATGTSADHKSIPGYITTYRSHFLPISVKASRALPGAARVVGHFFGRMRLAIATSRRSDGAIRILDSLGWRSSFSAIVGLEQVRCAKPDPEGPLLALRRVGAAAQVSFMVGDTPDDMSAGKRAGMTTVGVTTGSHSGSELEEAGADHVLGRISGLIEILDGQDRQLSGG